jgi:LuxR family maltose regulon positive regulatory protein
MPHIRTDTIRRQRLLDKIDLGLQGKLTLISAPAGFGKTTLICNWLSDNKYKKFGWFSIDGSDNHLHQFLQYFIAALEKIDPPIGESIKPILQSSPATELKSIALKIINNIAKSSSKFLIVLDDYHFINNRQINELLILILKYQPPQLHLFIITRVDPALPLSRLRVRGELNEIRSSDLRFTEEEARNFLNQLMKLNLSNEDTQRLVHRTEGWIAGLQLAALSLQGRDDKTEFVNAFTGSHYYIIDYLMDEVISRQPDYIQEFLYKTAIFDRICAPMCDFVLEKSDADINSQRIIDDIRKRNLFLICINEKWNCYRYQHLFAEFLRQRLKTRTPEVIPKLFIRASHWYENRYRRKDEAIHYALIAKDYDHAAHLLQENAVSFLKSGNWDKMINLINRLPTEMLSTSPQLCIAYCWALFFSLEITNMDHFFRILESYPEANGAVLVLKAYRAHLSYNVEMAIDFSKKGLEHYSSQINSGKLEGLDLFTRNFAILILSTTYFYKGDLVLAAENYEKALNFARETQNITSIISSIWSLALIKLYLGELRIARQVVIRGLNMIFSENYDDNTFFYLKNIDEARNFPVEPSNIALLFLMLAHIHYIWNDMEKCEFYINQMVELSKFTGGYGGDYRGFFILLLFNLYQGNKKKAFDLLSRMDHQKNLSSVKRTRESSDKIAIDMRLFIYNKYPEETYLLDDVGAWIKVKSLHIDDDFNFFYEPEYFIYAKYLLFRNEPEKALTLLHRLLHSARRTKSKFNCINYLIFQSIAYYKLDQTDLALKSLKKAIKFAKPLGIIRNLIDGGSIVYKLLKNLSRKESSSQYINKLLSYFPEQEQAVKIDPFESLKQREISILRLMAQRFSNKEIAQELHLSVNTIKWYSKGIYRKLDVKNRRAAVAKAKKMGIL